MAEIPTEKIEIKIGGVAYPLTWQVHNWGPVARRFADVGDPRLLIHRAGEVWVDSGQPMCRVRDMWALQVMLWAAIKQQGSEPPKTIDEVAELMEQHEADGGSQEDIFMALFAAYSQGAHGKRWLDEIKKKRASEPSKTPKKAKNHKSQRPLSTGSTDIDTSPTASDTVPGSLSV